MYQPSLTITAVVIALLSLVITLGFVIYECIYSNSKQDKDKGSIPDPDNEQVIRAQHLSNRSALFTDPPPYTETDDALPSDVRDDAAHDQLSAYEPDGLVEWPGPVTQFTERILARPPTAVLESD